MFVRVGVALAALMMPSIAAASDWWLIDIGGKKPQREVIFMDKESIRPFRGKTRVWRTTVFEALVNKAKFDRVYMEFDCDGRTTGVVSFLDYGSDGQITNSSSSAEAYPKHIPIPPDSIGEKMLTFACLKEATIHIGAIENPIVTGTIALEALDRVRSK